MASIARDRVYPLAEMVHCNPSEKLERLYSYNHKYKKMENMVLKFLPTATITGVDKVRNTFLKGMYLIKKEEYNTKYDNVQELCLFHATDTYALQSILKDNFDWRRVSRGRFGFGTSFSPDAKYADEFGNRYGDGIMIISKVLVANTEYGYYNRIPEGDLKDVDTTISDPGYSRSGDPPSVYVKYNDNEFLPKYVVYYSL